MEIGQILSPEQVAFYNENGFVLAPALFTPEEAERLRCETQALAERLMEHRNIDATWGSAREMEEKARLRAEDQAPAQPRRAVPLRRLRAPHHRREARGRGLAVHRQPQRSAAPHQDVHQAARERLALPMHQDAPYFPHENHSMMAAIIHFDDAPEEKGCVRVVPGSHKLGMLDHIGEGSWHLPFDQYPLESSVPCPAKAGDVLFFSYLTIHGSGINVSRKRAPRSSSRCATQLIRPLSGPTNRAGRA
jgi:hypothetical protein